jgi:hypothetical protein
MNGEERERERKKNSRQFSFSGQAAASAAAALLKSITKNGDFRRNLPFYVRMRPTAELIKIHFSGKTVYEGKPSSTKVANKRIFWRCLHTPTLGFNETLVPILDIERVLLWRRGTSVARWFIFKPKILIWVNLGRPCSGRFWYFYVRFVYFTAKWYILWSFGTFGIFFPFWYVVPRKIWQPCVAPLLASS